MNMYYFRDCCFRQGPRTFDDHSKFGHRSAGSNGKEERELLG